MDGGSKPPPYDMHWVSNYNLSLTGFDKKWPLPKDRGHLCVYSRNYFLRFSSAASASSAVIPAIGLQEPQLIPLISGFFLTVVDFVHIITL